MQGIVLYKEIDGIELAYNLKWKLGSTGCLTNDLLGLTKTAKELWMDDIGTIALEATELIQKRLKEYNIELKTPQEDEFYVPIRDALEKYSNGNYRNEN
jgi:hypothetical protein